MIPYRSVPTGSGPSRPWPLLEVSFEETRTLPQVCLIDSGAAGVRLSAELARALGVALPPEPNAPDVIAGGTRSQVYARRCDLTVAIDDRVLTWSADVSFCDPWPHPFGLLGHTGFLDTFDVLLRGRDGAFELSGPNA